MRTIKFRAWQEHNKKMLSHEDLIDKGWNFEDLNWDESQSTLMQFTGLKDKNKKEIYEGDIIKWGKEIRKVEFMKGGFFGFKGKTWDMFLGDYTDNYGVIGNIYENKDLL